MAHSTLQLKADTLGFTEVGGLVVLPPYRNRREKIGKQLSYVRFAYMAHFLKNFRNRLIVEYLPQLSAHKDSPLWDAVGQKCTGLSYHHADRLSAKNKEFVLALFPKEKIDCRLLPKAATRTLGVPGRAARHSLRLLQRIGFRFLHQIDPFDGGPFYGANLRRVSLIRKTRFLKFYKGPLNLHIKGRPRGIVLWIAPARIRAVLTAYRIQRGFIHLPHPAVTALGLKGGERLSITPFDV